MLHVHNTRTKRKEPFVPAQPRVVRIYTCGLTVYAPMHIGHARTYCFWDTFRRWLEYRGYHVVGVINYTDIDDRIMAQGGDAKGCVDVAERMIAGFRRDCRALHIKDYGALDDIFASMNKVPPSSVSSSLAYAKGKGKRLAIPEWGVAGPRYICSDPGSDNPLFMQMFHTWLAQNAGSIAFEGYFNGNAGGNPSGGTHKIAPTTWNPRAAAMYRSLW